MEKILLISEQTLKQLSPLSPNMDGVYLYPSICLAQDLDLTNIIGSALVSRLCKLVSSGEIDDYSDYKFLLDEYVTNYLVWAVTANIVPLINYKLANAGTSTNNDTQRNTLDYSNSKNLKLQYENYADAYATKMKKYLCHNSSLYPEYHQWVNCEGAQEPQRCGIVFDHTKKHYTYYGK